MYFFNHIRNKFDLYKKLINIMDLHDFTPISFDGLNECYMMSDYYLDLSKWRRDVFDSIKLLEHHDFQFYRDYIKRKLI